MRGFAFVVSLALLLVASVPAAAHEGEIHHGQFFQGTLARQGVITQPLSFEGPLIAGWVFMLGAKVQGGALEAELTTAGTLVATFIIQPTDRWIQTMALPITGIYSLTLRNRGSTDVTFGVYFDQSCNCVGKVIPPQIPTGMVIFNVDTSGPSTVFAQINEPRAMEVKVSAALRTDPLSLWPEDFQVLAVSEEPVQRQAGPEVPPVLLHELEVSVPEATRVYFFVEGQGLTIQNPQEQDLLITPYIELRPVSEPLSVWVYVGIAAALVVGGALVLWRGRQRAAENPGRSKAKGVSPRGGGRGGRRTQTLPRSRR